MSGLELFHGTGDTLADRMRAAVEAEGLLSLVNDAKRQVRQALADAVDDTSKQTGTSFTARHEGWAAQFTDPQPRPQVSDREAFGRWAAGEATLVDAVEVERVEVTDQTRALEALREALAGEPLDGVATKLLDSLKVTGEYVLPEDPFAPLVKAGRVKVTPTAVVDLETGEPVPGTTVTCKDPELRLAPKDRTVREAAKRDVADKLGVNLPALEGAGDE